MYKSIRFYLHYLLKIFSSNDEDEKKEEEWSEEGLKVSKLAIK